MFSTLNMKLLHIYLIIHVLGYCYGSNPLDQDYYDDALANPWNVRPKPDGHTNFNPNAKQNPFIKPNPCMQNNPCGQNHPCMQNSPCRQNNPCMQNNPCKNPNQQVNQPAKFKPVNPVTFKPNVSISIPKTWKPKIHSPNPKPVPSAKEGVDVSLEVNVNKKYPSKSKVKHYVKGIPWTKVSWIQAKRNCKKQGQELATITSKKEQIKFETFMKEAGVVTDDVWIGLSDLEDEGNFKWIDGKPLSYWGFSNWLPGEPSNTGGMEHCAEVVTNIQFWVWQKKGKPDHYQWNDSQCDSPEYYSFYVCQYYTDKKFGKKN